MNKHDLERLWTRREVMDYLNISAGTYYKLLSKGALTGVKKGNTTLFFEEEVRSYVDSLPVY